jgi:hypothetical protein
MFRALFGGLWFENFKGNESLFGGLGLFMRSQAQLWPYFCNFWVLDLLDSLSMADINILLSYHLNIKHFNMVLNLGFVFICTISDDKLMQNLSYFV